tara:strand:+ start:191 stop:442 length:252 start_codon:yes stop_codon:yes gene_type:complete
MARINDLVLKYHSLYLEEERREAVFRLNDKEDKLPKDIGYDEKLEARYLQAYEDLDADKINKEQALEILTKIMEDYYGIKYPL